MGENNVKNKENDGFFSSLKRKFFGTEKDIGKKEKNIPETNTAKEIKNTNIEFAKNSKTVKKESVKKITFTKLDVLKGDNTNFEKLFKEGNLEKILREKINSGDFKKINSFTNNLDLFISKTENPEYIHSYLKSLKLRKNACPDNIFIIKLREKYEKYLFGNLEKKLIGYETKTGENAFEAMKKELEKKYCSFDLIEFLSELKNSQTKKFLNLENIAIISLTIAGYKKQLIEKNIYKLTGYASENINLLKKEEQENLLKKLNGEYITENGKKITKKEKLEQILNDKKNTNFALQNLSSSKEIEIIIEAKKKNTSNKDLKEYIIDTKKIEEIKNNLEKKLEKNLKSIFSKEELEKLFLKQDSLEKAILFLEKKENKNLEEKNLLIELKIALELLKKTKKIEKKYDLDEKLKENVINKKTKFIFEKENNQDVDNFIDILKISKLKNGEEIAIEVGNNLEKNIDYIVEKTSYGYDVKMGENKVECNNLFEVKNVLETGQYFSKLGFGFLLKNINFILRMMNKYLSEINIDFDPKNGVSIREKRQYLKVFHFLLKEKNEDQRFEKITDLGRKDEYLKDESTSKYKNYFYLQAVENGWYSKTHGFQELKFIEILKKYNTNTKENETNIKK